MDRPTKSLKRRGQGYIFRKTGTRLWTIQYYQRGKRIRESTGTANRNQAVKLLNKRLADAAAGKAVGPAVEGTILSQILAMVEADYRANSRRSLDRVQQGAAHLLSFFGQECRVNTITHDRITDYAAHRLGEGSRPSTVNYEQSILRRGFRLGMRAGKVNTRPDVAMLHADNVRKGFFEPGQFKAVLRLLPSYLRPLLQVAYMTGWRVRSELLTRQWRHVDLNAGWLRLEPGEGKTAAAREFPLTPELKTILGAQRAAASRIEHETALLVPWTFFHPDGTPIRDFRYAWRKACKAAGVPGRLVHDFRRTAVRNLERAGVPRSAAMAMTGHKTEAVYRRYAITDAAMLREAAARLARFHAAQGVTTVSPTSAPSRDLSSKQRLPALK
jgi:integrase